MLRDRTRTGASSPPQRDDRLDGKRERQSEAANYCKAAVAEVWLSTGQAGDGNSNGVATGRTAMQGLGNIRKQLSRIPNMKISAFNS